MTFSERAVEAGAKAIADELRIPFEKNSVSCRDYALVALTAALAVDGLALVPKEPTDAMKVVGGMKAEDIIFGGEGNYPTIFDAMNGVWSAMLAAASDGEVG